MTFSGIVGLLILAVLSGLFFANLAVQLWNNGHRITSILTWVIVIIILFGCSFGITLLDGTEQEQVWHVECYEGERQIFNDYVTGNSYQGYLVETGAEIDLKDVSCVWTEVVE